MATNHNQPQTTSNQSFSGSTRFQFFLRHFACHKHAMSVLRRRGVNNIRTQASFKITLHNCIACHRHPTTCTPHQGHFTK